MDRYMKAFVVMSMLYLLAGAVLGIRLAWSTASLQLRFAHVHLNLLGFMAMMIFGVGYFILPRFSGRTLRWPDLVPVHFWVSNLSLVGMVVFYSVWPTGLLACAIIQALSTVLFLGNVGGSMIFSPQEAGEREKQLQGPLISNTTKVAELLENWPKVREMLVARGVQAFSDPQHVEHVRKLGVTLGMLAKRHSLDEKELLSDIASAVGGRVESGGSTSPEGSIRKDSVIGDVIRDYPSTEEVFRRFYGEGCFSCPGQAFETIAQSAMMHSVELEKILSELNRAALKDGASRSVSSGTVSLKGVKNRATKGEV